MVCSCDVKELGSGIYYSVKSVGHSCFDIYYTIMLWFFLGLRKMDVDFTGSNVPSEASWISVLPKCDLCICSKKCCFLILTTISGSKNMFDRFSFNNRIKWSFISAEK